MKDNYIIFYRFNHKPMRIAFTNKIYLTTNPNEIDGNEDIFYILKLEECNIQYINEINNYK